MQLHMSSQCVYDLRSDLANLSDFKHQRQAMEDEGTCTDCVGLHLSCIYGGISPRIAVRALDWLSFLGVYACPRRGHFGLV
jgi:hypothetical protein